MNAKKTIKILLCLLISGAVSSCAFYKENTESKKIVNPPAAAPPITTEYPSAATSAPPPAPAPTLSSGKIAGIHSVPQSTQSQSSKKPEKLILAPKKSAAKPEIDYDAEFKKQLLNANIAVSITERANINEDVRVELLISLQKEAENLIHDLSESGKHFSSPIIVSRILSATVTAPDFEVKNITPERQILSKTDNTNWLWTLKPNKVGVHRIDIGVTAILKMDNEETEYQIKTFKKTVEIEITPAQIIFGWISKYWQWLASTIVLPLLLWAYKSRKKSTDQS